MTQRKFLSGRGHSRGRRIDGNQTAIVNALAARGVSVVSLAGVGKGCPDLLVGFRGLTALVEVKQASGELTPDEKDFAAKWAGQPICVVRSAAEALAVFGL